MKSTDASRQGAFAIAFAPVDWIRFGLGYGYSQESSKRVQSFNWFGGTFFQTETSKSRRHTFNANMKLRAAAGELAGGTHELFLLVGVNAQPAATALYQGSGWWLPPGGIRRTIRANFAFEHGLQSSHRWAIGASGVSVTVVNTALFRNEQYATGTKFTWTTQALAAHEGYGVALGPKLRVRADIPGQTGKQPYVLAGAVGIWQPAKLINMPALAGLTLEGSALWLVNRKTDSPTWGFGPPVQPTRIRTEVQARARYVYEY